MITKDCIESAYCFFHQKLRVYQFSTMEWQKDDIEWAIGDYVDSMNPELYELISEGNNDFLRHHVGFREELQKAVELLEKKLDAPEG